MKSKPQFAILKPMCKTLNDIHVKAMMDSVNKKMESYIAEEEKKTPEQRERDLADALAEFATKFASEQKSLDPDDAKLLEDNLWNLV